MKLYVTNFKDYMDEIRARSIKKSFYFLDNNTEPIKESIMVKNEKTGEVEQAVDKKGEPMFRTIGINYTSFVRFTAQEVITDGSGKAIETNLVSCMVTVLNQSITNNEEATAADKEIIRQKDLKVTEFKGVLPKVELVEGVWVI